MGVITTRGRYAVRVLLDLAENGRERAVPLKDIANRQGISKKYLEIIVKDMVSGGFVAGVSGKGGGYRLLKKPEECTIGEVLEWMEGTLSPVACLSEKENTCPRKAYCQTLPLWTEYYELERKFFYGKRLSDLLGNSLTGKGE